MCDAKDIVSDLSDGAGKACVVMLDDEFERT